MHQQADDDRKNDGADSARYAQFQAENAGGEDDGQNVDRRPGVEERCGWPKARAHMIDPGKERQHRAGADRQDRARNRGDPVGQPLVRFRAEVFHHRLLADKDADRPGYKKGRHQAEQHMLARVPFDQVKGLHDRVVEPFAADGHIVQKKKCADDPEQSLELFFPVHGLLLPLQGSFGLALHRQYTSLPAFISSMECCNLKIICRSHLGPGDGLRQAPACFHATAYLPVLQIRWRST